MTKIDSRIAWLSTILLSVLLVIMPFHAFIITVSAHFIGHKEVLSIWKEIVIFLLGITTLLYWARHQSVLKFDAINILAISIVGLSLLVSLSNLAFHNAILIGVKTNLFPFVVFAAAQVFSSYFTDKRLRYLVFVPAVLVTVLAVLQPYLFPPSFLLRIGYGPEGSSGAILAGQYIESAASTVRAFSTLGGPNQLGTYLIIPSLISLAYFVVVKKWAYLLLSLFFAMGVYVSYSRSALIGLVFGICTIIAMQLPKKFRFGTFIGLGFGLLVLLFLLLSPNQCTFVNALPKPLIHGSCDSGLLSGSDQQRVESQRKGVEAIIRQPFGYGLGSAGPASFNSTKPLITENWYLQIAIETGILGLLLYLAFFILLGRKYYKAGISNDTPSILPKACLAILVSVGVASMFLHAPADSTLALIGFSIFGLVKGRTV